MVSFAKQVALFYEDGHNSLVDVAADEEFFDALCRYNYYPDDEDLGSLDLTDGALFMDADGGEGEGGAQK